MAELTTLIEHEQQKYLMYRLYDCNDMIKVLRPFCQDTAGAAPISSLMANAISAKDARFKRHNLEQELIKMQKELLELELKYGPLAVELPNDDDLVPSPTEKALKAETAPSAEPEAQAESPECQEELSPVAAPADISQEKSTVIEAEVSVEKEALDSLPVATEIENLSAAELAAKVSELEDELSSLETQIEQACEREDFELADSLQQ